MKTAIDAALMTALQAETARKVLFVDLQTTIALRYSTLDVRYYLAGNLYLPREIRLDMIAMQSGLAVDRANITIENVGREMSAVLLSGNERGKTCILYIAAIADSGALTAYGEFFRGILSNYDISDQTCTVNLVNELALWSKKTLRKTSVSCPWPFKGTECTYAGSETWCDQTYDRCEDLSNTDQFGGEPYLADLQEKEIFFGRKGKK